MPDTTLRSNKGGPHNRVDHTNLQESLVFSTPLLQKAKEPLKMMSDGVMLVCALAGLFTTIFLILFVAGVFSGPRRVADANQQQEEQEEEGARVVRGGAGRRGGLAALRKRKDKDRKKREEEEARQQQQQEAHDEAQQQEGDDEEQEQEQEPRFMTKKELLKEQKRREREELRRFDEQQREERKRREDAKEEAYQKKREEEARLEQLREEEERKEAEAKAKQEQDEFEQWKSMFSVEETGAKLDEDSQESQQLLQEFIEYIKSHKVVFLEDLGTEFHLSTQEAIDRVQKLQESNQLTGIIDDRGKFIYITQEEMQQVVNLIQRKGRMSLEELSKQCNEIIRLEGSSQDTENDSSSLAEWLEEEEQATAVEAQA